MNFSFHPDAEGEFVEAIDYYETCASNLGQDFALDLYETIARIVANPNVWPNLDGEVRRCQTKRFPYGVVYAVEGEDIRILAVMHLHRKPDYWKVRLLASKQSHVRPL